LNGSPSRSSTRRSRAALARGAHQLSFVVVQDRRAHARLPFSAPAAFDHPLQLLLGRARTLGVCGGQTPGADRPDTTQNHFDFQSVTVFA